MDLDVSEDHSKDSKIPDFVREAETKVGGK